MSGRIILLRHGQTFSNVERLLDTRPPGAELTERGRAQAAEVGVELAELVGAGEGGIGSLKAWYSSVALRAQQTAMIAARAFERAAGLPEHAVGVEVVAGVHEIFAGEFEMDNSEDAHREYTAALRGWIDGDPAARMAGGETYADLLARYQPVLEEIAASLDDASTVIVTTHGAAIRVVTRHAGGVDPDFAFTGYMPNCRFTVLEPNGMPFGQWDVTRWADTELV